MDYHYRSSRYSSRRKNRHSGSRKKDYLFFVIIIFFAILASVYIYIKFSKEDEKISESNVANLNILECDFEDVDILLAGNDTPSNPTGKNDKIREKDMIKTKEEGIAEVYFDGKYFNGVVVRMNNDTGLWIKEFSEKKIVFGLTNGEIYVNSLGNKQGDVFVDTNYGTVSVKNTRAIITSTAGATDYVRVLEEDLIFKIFADNKKKEKEIKTFSIKKDQEITINEKITDEIQAMEKTGENYDEDIVEGVSVKSTEWIKFNEKVERGDVVSRTEDKVIDLDGDIESIAEETIEIKKDDKIILSVISPKNSSKTNQKTLDFSGNYDPQFVSLVVVNGKDARLNKEKKEWIIKSVEINEEGKNLISIEYDDELGTRQKAKKMSIYYDLSGPSKPVITSHRKEETVAKEPLVLQGTVSRDTTSVKVNDFLLKEYENGSGKWTYKAMVKWGNLKKGENEYIVVATDSAGNSSESSIIINYTGEATIEKEDDKEDTKKEDDKEDDATKTIDDKKDTKKEDDKEEKKAISLQKPTVTTNSGKTLTTTESKKLISGTCDKVATKLIINGYSLEKFIPGKGTWTYFASLEYSTMKEGENVYNIYSVDKDGNKSATLTYKIIKK